MVCQLAPPVATQTVPDVMVATKTEAIITQHRAQQDPPRNSQSIPIECKQEQSRELLLSFLKNEGCDVICLESPGIFAPPIFLYTSFYNWMKKKPVENYLHLEYKIFFKKNLRQGTKSPLLKTHQCSSCLKIELKYIMNKLRYFEWLCIKLSDNNVGYYCTESWDVIIEKFLVLFFSRQLWVQLMNRNRAKLYINQTTLSTRNI